MTVKTYQADKVTVAFRGVPITGFAPGTFVSAVRNNDAWSITVGSAGDATRSKSGDYSGRVTLTLLGSSESNGVLDAFEKIDRRTGGGVGALAVKDLSGGDTITCATAWIVKPPDQEKSNEETNREWIFETDDLVIVNAGIPLTP